MTASERKIVQEALSHAVKRKGWADRFTALFMGLGCGLILGGFLIFLPLIAWNWLTDVLHKPGLSLTTDTFRILGAVGGLIGTILAGRLIYQNDCDTRREAERIGEIYQRDLEEGEAEVWHCMISRVVEIEQEDDEGPGFFLELAPGQILVLQGHYLYDLIGEAFALGGEAEVSHPCRDDADVWPPAPCMDSSSDEQSFPCRQFDLVYAPNSRLLLDLVCLGERFKEWRMHSPDWEMYRKTGRYPEDGDILLVSLDNLDADLRRWAAQHEQGKPS